VYGKWRSWTKTIDFSFYPAPDFSPVCFTNCGDIVGPSDDGGLVKITDKGQLLEHRSHDDCYFVRSYRVFAFTPSWH